MKYEEIQMTRCPKCGKEIRYNESTRDVSYLNDECVSMMTTDCHGIPFRKVCLDCYEEIMDTIGFDGQYYTEADECIWDY